MLTLFVLAAPRQAEPRQAMLAALERDLDILEREMLKVEQTEPVAEVAQKTPQQLAEEDRQTRVHGGVPGVLDHNSVFARDRHYAFGITYSPDPSKQDTLGMAIERIAESFAQPAHAQLFQRLAYEEIGLGNALSDIASSGGDMTDAIQRYNDHITRFVRTTVGLQEQARLAESPPRLYNSLVWTGDKNGASELRAYRNKLCREHPDQCRSPEGNPIVTRCLDDTQIGAYIEVREGMGKCTGCEVEDVLGMSPLVDGFQAHSPENFCRGMTPCNVDATMKTPNGESAYDSLRGGLNGIQGLNTGFPVASGEYINENEGMLREKVRQGMHLDPNYAWDVSIHYACDRSQDPNPRPVGDTVALRVESPIFAQQVDRIRTEFGLSESELPLGYIVYSLDLNQAQEVQEALALKTYIRADGTTAPINAVATAARRIYISARAVAAAARRYGSLELEDEDELSPPAVWQISLPPAGITAGG